MHGFAWRAIPGAIPELLYERRSDGDVAAGNHFASVRVGDDLAVAVDDVDDAIAHAGVANSGEQAVDRNDRSKHPGELAVERQRNGQRPARGGCLSRARKAR